MTTTIKLKSPKQLGPAVRLLSKKMDKAAVKALQLTARYGATMAVRTSAMTIPRPRATGTFERSFVVTKLHDGALLSNTAKHGRFVEVGRAAGRQPPVEAIMQWLVAKGLERESEKARRAAAFRIARKIGRRGIKGRHVLKRTIPAMRKRLKLEMATQMRKAFESAAR